MKMKDRNSQLKTALGAMASKETVREVASISAEDTKNRQGFAAYSVADELRLLAMLNTLKVEPQFYRSENDTMKELRDLIERVGLNDPYFVAQAIVWSRCKGEGMRTINHLAAALLSPFISGQDYAKRFYGAWDKKNGKGGCIYRLDDMSEIKEVYNALNKGVLSNAMKKGFASVLENADAYQLAKYSKTVIDIANLTHPVVSRSKAVIGDELVLKAIMEGKTVSADTWENANSEAGQEVAKAVREGKLSKEKAEKILTEAKADNWESLLKDGKLGILAALRNIRNILKVNRSEVVTQLTKLLENDGQIRKGLIMPYQIDTAYEIVRNEFSNYDARTLLASLTKAYEKSVPNLAAALSGRTCVMIDCSGSMRSSCFVAGKQSRINATACEKAGLLAATIAKATNADVVRFGSHAEFVSYSPTENVFDLGKKISNPNMGGTSIATAWELIRTSKRKYDRVIILSDNECNTRSSWSGDWTSTAYKKYVHDVASPYVYCIDLAAYGTTPLKNEGKVNYYFGFGYAMFEDIASREFNPQAHIDKVREIVI